MRHDPGSQTCPRSTGPLGPCNLSATVTCTCVHTHTHSLSHVCLSVDCRMFWIIGARFPDVHLLSVRLLGWVLEGWGCIYIYIYMVPPPPPQDLPPNLSVYIYEITLQYTCTHMHTYAHTHTRTHMQRGLVYMKISVYEHGYIIRKRLRIQYHAQQSSLEARLH